MAALRFLFLSAWLGLVLAVQQVRYDNYSVYKVYMDDMEQIKLINSMQQKLKVGVYPRGKRLSFLCSQLAAQQLA